MVTKIDYSVTKSLSRGHERRDEEGEGGGGNATFNALTVTVFGKTSQSEAKWATVRDN